MTTDMVTGLAGALRQVGVAVSTPALLDAYAALSHVDITDRRTVCDALRCVMVKRHADRVLFDVAFAIWFGGPGERTDDELGSVRAAVLAHAGVVPGRYLGSAYHVDRVLHRIDAVQHEPIPITEGDLDVLLAQAAAHRHAQAQRHAIAGEVRRLVPTDVALAELQGSNLADRDLLRLRPGDERALHGTVRALRRRLRARRRRHVRKVPGAIDGRATLRRAAGTAGIPVDIVEHRRRPRRADLVVLADVSGSVAAFTRFSLQLVFAIAATSSSQRVYAFVDDVVDVSNCFRSGATVTDAVDRMQQTRGAHGGRGHSDYGAVFEAFVERHRHVIRSSTTVIVLGDARANYHPVRAEALATVARRARHVYWLNPEPLAHWDTADSVMSAYAAHCDDVFECRTVAQLADVVSRLPMS